MKLYMPLEDKLLVIKGYFKKAYLQHSILHIILLLNIMN